MRRLRAVVSAAVIGAAAAMLVPSLARIDLRAAEQLTARQKYFPQAGDAWVRKTPAEVGMDAAALDKAVAYAKTQGSSWDFEKDQVRTFGSVLGSLPKDHAATNGVILRHGYIVAEWGDTSKNDPTYSVAKSVMSTVFGVAYDRRLIKDLDEPVKNMIADGGYDSPHNAKITWRHHLQQTSEWEGDLWGKSHSFVGHDQFGAGERPARVLQDPGTFYEYNDVRINRFALSLLRVWKRPLPEVFRTEVMDKIGASPNWQWMGYHNSNVVIDGKTMPSVSGGTRWGGGLWINTRDEARFGYLFLRRGRWADKQIVSEKWVAMATTPGPVGPDYGFLWWLNTHRRQWPNAPASSFAAVGNGSNTIWIDPDHDLVIAWRWHQGRAADELFRQVVASVRTPVGTAAK